MVVCFCLNNLGSLGLGATLNSLVKNCSDTARLRLYFLCASLDENIKAAIKNLVTETGFKGTADFIDFDPDKHFKRYRSLQGDRTTYGRILIPDLIPHVRVLYLDTDLIIDMDVLELGRIQMGEKVIAAVGGGCMQYSLEQNFYVHTLGLSAETKSFNAGVLMINIPAWKKHAVKEKLFALADRYPNELLAADQTLLNAFFAGDFYNLPAKYNVTWYANKRPAIEEDAVFHFVGSPKPWDYFGKYMHTGFRKWDQYNTAGWSKNVLSRYTAAQLKRFWTIRRSYVKTLLGK